MKESREKVRETERERGGEQTPCIEIRKEVSIGVCVY